MTQQSVSQSGVEILYRATAVMRVAQAGVEALTKERPAVRIAQAAAEVLHRVLPQFSLSQAGVEYLHKAQPCTTRWAQVWTIARADGEVLRFTSLDRTLDFGGATYAACDSLSPSAAENAAEAGSVGNMELTGLVAAGAVSEADLMAGRYDGAQVSARLIDWRSKAVIRVLLNGTFGAVSFDNRSFTVEVIGAGARLAQTPLVKVLRPTCPYLFGDPDCGKDLSGLIVSGTVGESIDGRRFVDATRGEPAGYFSNGRVIFTSGDNAGVAAEIETHEAGGRFTLWPRLGFAIRAGDAYQLIPGCSQAKASSGGTPGCQAWGNYVNFGGEPDVPGADKVAARPDVKK